MKILLVKRGTITRHVINSLSDVDYNFDFIQYKNLVLNVPSDIVKNRIIYPYTFNVNDIDLEFYTQWLTDLIKKNDYTYLFPTFYDHLTPVYASINERFNFKGIKSEHAHYSKKHIYMKEWDRLGIPIPQNLYITDSLNIPINQYKYPLIVKPTNGTSGVGVKLIYSENELIDFFSINHNKQTLYQEKFGDMYRHWEYFSFGGEYIIQEYIKDASMYSMQGRVVNSVIYDDGFYDVEITNEPYFAEVAYRYPSTLDKTIIDNIYLDINRFIKHIQLDNSPFMFDILVSNNQYYFIDFGMRFSTYPMQVLTSYDKHIPKYWLDHLFHNKEYKLDNLNHYYFRKLNLKKGILKRIECSKLHLAKKHFFPAVGKTLSMSRNDYLLDKKGHFIVEGDTRLECENKMNQLFNSLHVEYE